MYTLLEGGHIVRIRVEDSQGEEGKWRKYTFDVNANRSVTFSSV